MALVGVEPKTLVSEPDALTTRPPFWFGASDPYAKRTYLECIFSF